MFRITVVQRTSDPNVSPSTYEILVDNQPFFHLTLGEAKAAALLSVASKITDVSRIRIFSGPVAEISL